MNNKLFNNKNEFKIILIACAIITVLVEAIVYGYNTKEVPKATSQAVMLSGESELIDSASTIVDTDSLKPTPISRPKDSLSNKSKDLEAEFTGDVASFEGIFDGFKLKCKWKFVTDPSNGTSNDGVVKALVTWKGNKYVGYGTGDFHDVNLKLYYHYNEYRTVPVGILTMVGNNSGEGPIEIITLKMGDKDFGEYDNYASSDD